MRSITHSSIARSELPTVSIANRHTAVVSGCTLCVDCASVDISAMWHGQLTVDSLIANASIASNDSLTLRLASLSDSPAAMEGSSSLATQITAHNASLCSQGITAQHIPETVECVARNEFFALFHSLEVLVHFVTATNVAPNFVHESKTDYRAEGAR